MSDSDSDDENIIKYGTPLEPYEEDELPTKRKYQQPTDQYAVDAHGRRRFHGAFTGGFSAGFGNTVGTPEGWTPSVFKSSRNEKAQVSSQRPEDFMDEEDRGEFGIAPRHMQTHTEFSGQKRHRQQRYHDGPIPGEPVLEQLVRAVHETAAVRILRGMGWREGQGAGDRLRRHDKKRAKEQHRVYGCYMPPELKQNEETQDSDDSSGSEYDFETLFAPDDYEPYILHRKNDRFGLGYSGLSRHSVLGAMAGEYGSEGAKSHLVMKDKGRKVSIRGQAFGVGAFEADDADIYATEDMSHYDFALGTPAHDKPKKVDNKERTGNVIEGFVKASKPIPSVSSYPPPALPRDYAPGRAAARRTRFEPTTAAPRDQGLGRHELTANARGALLGETPIPKITLQTTTQADVVTDKPPQPDPITKVLAKDIVPPESLDYIPITDSGKKLTKIFKPFVGNPQKQARYERYLEDKNSVLEQDGDIDRLSEWEKERELVEFEQAAKLYRPLTGIMGDRFTHATQPDDGALNPLCAVAKSSINRGSATVEQIEAAEKGLYGVMTRRLADWRPEGLVCKRFNVPDPGGPRIEQKKEDKPKVSYSVFSYLESSVHDKDSFAKEQGKFSGSKSLDRDTITKANNQKSTKINNVSTNTDQTSPNSDQISINTDQKSTQSDQSTKMDGINAGFNKRMTVAELFMKESEKTKEHGNEVTETINQFDKMDLYKAIFLSDSEDETEVTNKNNANDFIDVPKNVERNTSPPRGIFANIDFDELNSWKRIDKPETSRTVEKVDNVISNAIPDKNSVTSQEEGVYGPKIPDFLQKRLESEAGKIQPIEIDSTSSEDSWVDINEVKNKKKKKKSKKHKSKHKKKTKTKKKDR